MFCSSYFKCHIFRYILVLIFWNTYFLGVLNSKLNRSNKNAKNEEVNLDVGDMKRGLLLEMQTLIHNKAERSFNEFLLTNVYVLLILDIRPIIRFMLKFFVVHSELNLWHFSADKAQENWKRHFIQLILKLLVQKHKKHISNY